MKIIQQPLGPVQANCYLVMENHHAILIDPADRFPNLESILKENQIPADLNIHHNDTHPKPIKEGINEIAGFEIEAIYCPGHSIGSTVLRIEDCLFTGDVLFQGSIGRMDLATGSVSMMKQSLKKLYQLDKDYKVYPGHGPSTSLSQEKKWNESLKYAEIY